MGYNPGMESMSPDVVLAALERLVRHYRTAEREAMARRPPDLSLPQVRVLLAVGLLEGQPMREVAERLGLSRPSVSLTADSLVAKGYLDRRPGRDRRQTILSPTAHGWELISDLRGRLWSELDLSSWLEADLKALVDVCDKA